MDPSSVANIRADALDDHGVATTCSRRRAGRRSSISTELPISTLVRVLGSEVP